MDFIALCFCLDLDSLAAIPNSVAVETVNNGEAHATRKVKEIRDKANNSLFLTRTHKYTHTVLQMTKTLTTKATSAFI